MTSNATLFHPRGGREYIDFVFTLAHMLDVKRHKIKSIWPVEQQMYFPIYLGKPSNFYKRFIGHHKIDAAYQSSAASMLALEHGSDAPDVLEDVDDLDAAYGATSDEE